MQHKFINQLGLSTLLLLIPLVSFATGTISSVSSYIYTTELDSTDSSNMTVYVGRAVGATGACSGSGTNSCTDSCSKLTTALTSGTTDYVCNNNGIYDSLLFTVTFSGSEASSYTDKTNLIKAFVGQNEVTIEEQPTVTPGTANQVVSVSMTWANIFSAMGLSAPNGNTTSFKDKTLTIGFDPEGDANDSGDLADKVTIQINYRFVAGSPTQIQGCDSSISAYSGFCEYYAYPGDEKIYIFNPASFAANNSDLIVENLTSGTSTNSADSSGMVAAAIRVFYKESGDFTSFTANDWASQDIPIVNNVLRNGKVTGLQNGTSYSLMVANVDQAGNVTYFFDPAKLSNTDSAATLGKTQAATPQPVTGLLDNKNCFIATAAYGSGDAADVETLRKFRNRYLLTWEGGKSFVRFYYKYSPPIANFIADREWLKFVVRGSLKPFVLLATLAFNYGLPGVLILFGAAIVIFTGSLTWLSRRRFG